MLKFHTQNAKVATSQEVSIETLKYKQQAKFVFFNTSICMRLIGLIAIYEMNRFFGWDKDAPHIDITTSVILKSMTCTLVRDTLYVTCIY